MESWKLKLAGHWNEVKGQIRQKYANVIEDDLLYEKGKEEELLGKLQVISGKTKQDLADWIEKL